MVETGAARGFEPDGGVWEAVFSITAEGQTPDYTGGSTSYARSGDNADTITGAGNSQYDETAPAEAPVTGMAGAPAPSEAGAAAAGCLAWAVRRRSEAKQGEIGAARRRAAFFVRESNACSGK